MVYPFGDKCNFAHPPTVTDISKEKQKPFALYIGSNPDMDFHKVDPATLEKIHKS